MKKVNSLIFSQCLYMVYAFELIVADDQTLSDASDSSNEDLEVRGI